MCVCVPVHVVFMSACMRTCVCVRFCICVCVHACVCVWRQPIYLLVAQNLLFNRGESVTVQAGKVTASAWMDRKTVMVMRTNCQPSSSGTVSRKQRDGTSTEVPCPESIISYNKFMGGVDRGDQLRGYYRCRSKSRKFYKYIFFFLFDVAITNTYLLLKTSDSCPFRNFKSFRLKLAKEMIGDYCSRRRRGRGGSIIRPLPFRHFPIRVNSDGPRHPRGHCALHRDMYHRLVCTTWFCRAVWRVAVPHRRH